MATPGDDVIRAWMTKLVPTVDLNTMTTKQFIVRLGQAMGGVELSSKKAFIKATLTEILDEMDDDDDEEESSSEDEDEEVKPAPKKKRGGGGGLTAQKEISSEMAKFLGKQDRLAARTEIVKAIWAYVKENNLQNPTDKREIILDDTLKQLFPCDRFTMFTMNKYIGSHIHPYPPVDLTKNSSTPKKRKAPSGKKGEKKKRTPGQQAPYRLSPALADVCGKDILPRPQVTQALWVYIRANNLQNPNDKREILCDAKLQAVMGGNARVTMFSMNKHITPHLLEKLDKSMYIHEENDKDEDATSSEEEEESESESE